jgi:Tfp pilus assembly protein PilV
LLLDGGLFSEASGMMTSQKVSGSPGFSLLEVTISLGVLAVAIPLSLAGIASSTNSDMASRVDSMAASMVATGLNEWGATKDSGEEIGGEAKPPGDGEVWSMGFAAKGESCGRVEGEDYRNGCRNAGMAYLVRVEEMLEDDASSARAIRVSVEFPAMAAEAKRQRLEFFTLLP